MKKKMSILLLLGLLLSGCPEIATVTIRFDANGGQGTMKDMVVECGKEVLLSANTYKNEQKEFVSWNDMEDGTGLSYSDKAKIKPVADMTLYAQWASVEPKGKFGIENDGQEALFYQTKKNVILPFSLTGGWTWPTDLSQIKISVKMDDMIVADEAVLLDTEKNQIVIKNQGLTKTGVTYNVEFSDKAGKYSTLNLLWPLTGDLISESVTITFSPPPIEGAKYIEGEILTAKIEGTTQNLHVSAIRYGSAPEEIPVSENQTFKAPDAMGDQKLTLIVKLGNVIVEKEFLITVAYTADCLRYSEKVFQVVKSFNFVSEQTNIVTDIAHNDNENDNTPIQSSVNGYSFRMKPSGSNWKKVFKLNNLSQEFTLISMKVKWRKLKGNNNPNFYIFGQQHGESPSGGGDAWAPLHGFRFYEASYNANQWHTYFMDGKWTPGNSGYIVSTDGLLEAGVYHTFKVYDDKTNRSFQINDEKIKTITSTSSDSLYSKRVADGDLLRIEFGNVDGYTQGEADEPDYTIEYINFYKEADEAFFQQ